MHNLLLEDVLRTFPMWSNVQRFYIYTYISYVISCQRMACCTYPIVLSHDNLLLMHSLGHSLLFVKQNYDRLQEHQSMRGHYLSRFVSLMLMNFVLSHVDLCQEPVQCVSIAIIRIGRCSL